MVAFLEVVVLVLFCVSPYVVLLSPFSYARKHLCVSFEDSLFFFFASFSNTAAANPLKQTWCFAFTLS